MNSPFQQQGIGFSRSNTSPRGFEQPNSNKTVTTPSTTASTFSNTTNLTPPSSMSPQITGRPKTMPNQYSNSGMSPMGGNTKSGIMGQPIMGQPMNFGNSNNNIMSPSNNNMGLNGQSNSNILSRSVSGPGQSYSNTNMSNPNLNFNKKSPTTYTNYTADTADSGDSPPSSSATNSNYAGGVGNIHGVSNASVMTDRSSQKSSNYSIDQNLNYGISNDPILNQNTAYNQYGGNLNRGPGGANNYYNTGMNNSSMSMQGPGPLQPSQQQQQFESHPLSGPTSSSQPQSPQQYKQGMSSGISRRRAPRPSLEWWHLLGWQIWFEYNWARCKRRCKKWKSQYKLYMYYTKEQRERRKERVQNRRQQRKMWDAV